MNFLSNNLSLYLEIHLIGGLVAVLLCQFFKVHIAFALPISHHYTKILLPLFIFFIGRAVFEQFNFNGGAIIIALMFGAISAAFSGLLSFK